MKTGVIIFLSFLIFGQAYAGSADAHIVGKTASNRTSLEVDAGDISGILRHVKLTIDGKFYEISDGKDTAIRDKPNGIYILIIESDTHVFRMWMIPNSEKVIKSGSGFYKSKFAAVIEATDPRKKGKWTLTPKITIGCTLNYSI